MVHQVDRFNRAQPALRAEQLKPAPSERGIARRMKHVLSAAEASQAGAGPPSTEKGYHPG